MTTKTRKILICLTAAMLVIIVCLNTIFAPLRIMELGKHGRYKNGVRIPILMYHHFGDEVASGVIISPDKFESHMKALAEAGYTTVTFREVCDHVNHGTVLPEKPVLITIDDGYTSVYESAYPILTKYNMKATVFIVGTFHGKTTYKDTAHPLIPPHFGDPEAREMSESGLISIQSHSYDMHDIKELEQEYRKGAMRKPGEPRNEYDEALKADYALSSAQIEKATGLAPFVYSYPYGRHSNRSEALLKSIGVEATVTIVAGMSTIVAGDPESLYKLRRLTVSGDMTPEMLLKMVRTGRA